MKNFEIFPKIQRFKIRLDDWFLAKEIIKGQDKYQKFIVLTRARTGSNFLMSLLQSHPKIRAFEEVFTEQKRKIHWGYAKYPRSSKVLKIREEQPRKFIDEVVFRKFPPSVSAVGFKLFYYQAQSSELQKIWQYLKENKEIKIIHLKRDNLLKVCLSSHLAKITNQWILKDEKYRHNSAPVRLNYDDCLKLFEETKKWEEEYDSFFNEHQKIEVIYENLVQKTLQETKRIQQFLGVKLQRLYSLTLKQNKGTLPEIISNYYELKEKFEGSPWSKFFTE
ncbi:sulfotransferase [Okeania sp. SIO2B3]|uniref:sulfotransferase n=1 Tax=Okeania sp. SIO2B3 TaxID=2607784 RepID=UPI0013C13C81|nr:sulfotransferase [Okeania sp. SIO2B3]NET44527.1 sulfotransferase [Okeania sp. SIO2B3]